ncbi:thiol reductant ABC exporter subunit CydC [Herbiconiux sp. CPCC 203407]|uniref:Thiol reductant ABC exporter subunit CydC n=1 Tax=Herbiconiux oxytropis TaxID=2970915 RepID=A0AA41XDU0_9MICO|nr:thiol reductant ABC exporter subunit CydC [Herbiconiux oxytropis]MCS5720857.1 thiol reductant ABC exporter subunit CydC [Herbiconiux oxytropis]MCS5724334.1 thiol reductant ABC exporter subunit CydC [Herbiconiux oxytropis]
MKRAEVLRLAQPRLRRFLPGIVFGLLSALCAVGLLATSAYLITRAAEQPPILYLSMAMVGVRAFALGRAAFRYVERLFAHDAAFATLPDLRVGVYERLVPVSPDGLGHRRRGDLLSRLVADVDEQQNLPLRVVSPLVVSGLTAVAAVVVVWLLLPAAGLVLLLGLVLAAVLGTLVNAAVSARQERAVAGLRGDYQAELADHLENLDVLVAYGADTTHREQLARRDEILTRALVRRAAGSSVTAALVASISGIMTVVSLAVGIPQLGTGGFEGPALAVVALVPLAVFEVFAMVPLALGAWRQVAASATRIAEVVPDEVPRGIPVDAPAVTSPTSSTTSAAAGARVSLREVTARWPGEGAPTALGPVSLELAPGDRMLVRGPSGAGKTTLAHVLVRFLDHEGEFLVDGVDVRALPQAEVRRVIGLCEQRPHLFDDDIRQNLLFARDTATDDELLAVLERVGLADWVCERGGLSARVGERGALVSGGQAQRIAVARALLADFPVLVLDEPTANVDPDRADLLLEELLVAATADSRAVLLISHTPVPAALVTSTLELRAPTAL